MSSVLQPASGKGFAQPHVRNGVRAGRRIKRVGPAVEAGDDVAPLQTETARAPETQPSASRFSKSKHLSVRSLMPENGVIFSDGIEADRLDFNSGTEVQIALAEREGRLIV